LTIQITIIRIDDYGQWTLRLGSDREAALQMLQAKIYYDIQRLFSEVDCLVYPNRFDEYFAISNGLSIGKHTAIHKELERLYGALSLSMAIGRGKTPFEANLGAYEARKESIALDKRRKIFGLKSLAVPSWNRRQNNSSSNKDKNKNNIVRIMHIDVNDSADLSSKLSPYEVTTLVSKIYLGLSQQFLKKGAMTFFIGGDNFMVILNGTSKTEAKKIIHMVAEDTDIVLNCGIGIGRTGRKAAEAATKALDTIRVFRKLGKTKPFYEIRCL
jgi:GTP cyclohydrolase IIa